MDVCIRNLLLFYLCLTSNQLPIDGLLLSVALPNNLSAIAAVDDELRNLSSMLPCQIKASCRGSPQI
jgi:hypothetical protein